MKNPMDCLHARIPSKKVGYNFEVSRCLERQRVLERAPEWVRAESKCFGDDGNTVCKVGAQMLWLSLGG